MTLKPRSLLSARGLTRRFGGIHAVKDVNFDLNYGQIHAVIGPNGAGKSTFVGLLSGRISPDQGRIVLEDSDITALPAQARVRAGIGYTFQITSIFPALSVFDNVALAVQGGRILPKARRGWFRSGAELAAGVEAALRSVGLEGFERQNAGALSYGHQRQLELAMGLALRPKVLILDEPTQGLAAGEIRNFCQRIAGLVPDVSVLMIEHNMDVVMELADQITVLAAGQILAQGRPDQIRANLSVQEAYLGKG